MSKPFYVAQTGECRTPEEAAVWIRKRTEEAVAQGAQTTRNSYCGQRDVLQVEGWKEADADVDDLEPRWQPT